MIQKLKIDESCIVFDTETTGLNPERDEIIQLSIIDGTGKVLFDEYIKPSRRKKWPEAQKVSGISPEMVKSCKTFRFFRKTIQDIFDSHKTIIAYNIGFDADFLRASGVDVFRKVSPGNKALFDGLPEESETKDWRDVMIDFAEVYGEWSDYKNSYKWQKLSTAAAYYNFKFSAHNSLEDVKATLFVAQKLYE